MRELLTQTYANLMAHKLRSFLTMFGIIWGVISIVLLSAVSEGFQQGNLYVLKELGKNIIIIRNGRTSTQAGGERAGKLVRLDIGIPNFFMVLVVAAAGQVTLVSVALAVPLFVLMVALLYCLRSNAPAGDLDEVSAHVDQSARAIARIYGTRAVVFGHTHKAFGVWADGVFFGNSGTWAPMYHDIACTIPVETSRPLLWLRTDGESVSGGLYRFHDGQLHADGGDQTDPSEPRLPAELMLPPRDSAPALRYASLPGTAPRGASTGGSDQNSL